jgi:phosphonate transport system substrate-binding protein
MNKMPLRVAVVCFGLVFAFSAPISAMAAEPQAKAEDLTLAVFPHLPPRELEKVYAPIAARFGAALGKTVHFRSSSSYQKFVDKLDQTEPDIVFVQPFDYVRIADRYGYIPLATRAEPLETIVVVPQDSDMNSLASLKGKQVALPPSVAAVSLLLKAQLNESGMVPGKDVKLSHFRSHVSCMQQVVIGAADACGTAAPALRFFMHKMNTQLKIIAKTRSIPHTLFAVHPRVPEQEREKILQAILALSETEEGRALLKRGKLKPFIPINDSDYDEVRAFKALMK